MLARAAPDQYRWVTEQAGAIASGTVFDVGSGTGALLDEFKARGWQTFGVEPTPHFAAYAAARGHGVTAGFLGNHAEATYDLVTASHVLEHIAEPGPFLEAIRGRMRPDSRLFVEVPDIMRPYGHIWYLFFSVNHVYHYNSATLARLLTAHGFSVLAIEPGQRGLRVFCGLGTAPGMAVSGATPGDVLDSIHHYRSEFSARYFKEGIKEDVKLAARAVCGVLFGLRRGDRIYDAVSRAVRTSSGHRS